MPNSLNGGLLVQCVSSAHEANKAALNNRSTYLPLSHTVQLRIVVAFQLLPVILTYSYFFPVTFKMKQFVWGCEEDATEANCTWPKPAYPVSFSFLKPE